MRSLPVKTPPSLACICSAVRIPPTAAGPARWPRAAPACWRSRRSIGGENDLRYIAERLWPDVDYARAAGKLRSSLWRQNALGMVLAESSKTSVRLCGNVTVDVRLPGNWAARMISGTPAPKAYPRAVGP